MDTSIIDAIENINPSILAVWPPTGLLTLGLDTSKWQNGLYWPQAVYNGIRFALIKFSDGELGKDSAATYHWVESGKLGVLRAPYHFYRNSDPIKQAQNFYATYLARNNGMLAEIAPMIDVEVYRINWKLLRIHLINVGQLFGKAPIIYTSTNYWPKAQGYEKDYDLFQAAWSYYRDPAPVPGFNKWVFRQFTGSGHGFVWGTPPTSKELDLDVFNGTIEQLRERYA